MRFTILLAAAVALTALSSPAGAAPRRSRPPEPQQAREGDTCRKLPPGKRIVRLNLKPETNLGDLIAWISSITCKSFILPSTVAAASKTVTIVSPQLMTPEEAYRLFLDALDSVGLTVFRASGPFLRVIESSKAPHSPIPVIVPPPASSDETQGASDDVTPPLSDAR